MAAIERLLDLGVKPLLDHDRDEPDHRAAARAPHLHELPRALRASADALRKLHIEADSHEFQHGRGCATCGQTGYSGRVGIFEILRLTPRLKELVSRRATESEMTQRRDRAGTRLLLDDALEKVRQGLTTVEEILRVIRIEPSQHGGQANLLKG